MEAQESRTRDFRDSATCTGRQRSGARVRAGELRTFFSMKRYALCYGISVGVFLNDSSPSTAGRGCAGMLDSKYNKDVYEKSNFVSASAVDGGRRSSIRIANANRNCFDDDETGIDSPARTSTAERRFRILLMLLVGGCLAFAVFVWARLLEWAG